MDAHQHRTMHFIHGGHDPRSASPSSNASKLTRDGELIRCVVLTASAARCMRWQPPCKRVLLAAWQRTLSVRDRSQRPRPRVGCAVARCKLARLLAAVGYWRADGALGACRPAAHTPQGADRSSRTRVLHAVTRRCRTVARGELA
jgi:hypothetical protein